MLDWSRSDSLSSKWMAGSENESHLEKFLNIVDLQTPVAYVIEDSNFAST